MTGIRKTELGDFLKSRREKLSPQALNLSNKRRRRTRGLRREEVAELAGISVDWYARLEQGRVVSPSAATVDALAAALRLDEIEHAHLRALAQNTEQHRRFARETVPQPLRRLVESLNQPAYISGSRWDILAWNAAAIEIFTDFGKLVEEDRNILVYVLTEPSARRIFGANWANEAQRMVARFRATFDLWSDDPAFLNLAERLRRDSPEFAVWWNEHDVVSGAAGYKLLVHPEKGAQHFEYTTFQSNDDPALRLSVFRLK